MNPDVDDAMRVEQPIPRNPDDAIFQIYHGGMFANSEGNVITYQGGETHTPECKSETVFTNMMESIRVSLFGHRVWYKLSYEMFTELKLMYNGFESFQRMCLAAIWTKSVELYVEKDKISGVANDDRGHQQDIKGEGRQPDIEDIGRDRACDGEEGSNVDRAGNVRGSDVDEEDDFRGGDDGDEVCDSEATPSNSDDGKKTIRYKRGSGEIRLGQVFDSIHLFKEVVVDYSLKSGTNVKYTRWGSEKSEVRCALGGGCNFRIYYSFQKENNMYQVMTCVDEHSKPFFLKLLVVHEITS